MNKQTKIKIKLSGQDGNIFFIMGRVITAMKKGGFTEEAKQMAKEVTSSHSYQEALIVIADYVEVS